MKIGEFTNLTCFSSVDKHIKFGGEKELTVAWNNQARLLSVLQDLKNEWKQNKQRKEHSVWYGKVT